MTKWTPDNPPPEEPKQQTSPEMVKRDRIFWGIAVAAGLLSIAAGILNEEVSAKVAGILVGWGFLAMGKIAVGLHTKK